MTQRTISLCHGGYISSLSATPRFPYTRVFLSNFEDLPLSTRSAKTFPLSLVPTHTVTDASLSLNSCHPGPISACPVNQSKPSFLTPLLAPLVLFAGLDHLFVLTVSLSYFSTRLVSFIFTPLLSQSLPLALSSPFNI